jgi:DNA primase
VALLDAREVLDALGVEWAERGGRLMFLCPIHGDTTPSGVVYADEGRFFCFGCEERGDLVDFWAKARGVPRERAAVEMSDALGRRVGTVPPVDMGPAWAAKAIMESRLEELRDKLPMGEHATLGERIDKITWAYRKRKLDRDQLHGAVTRFLHETEGAVGFGVP